MSQSYTTTATTLPLNLNETISTGYGWYPPSTDGWWCPPFTNTTGIASNYPWKIDENAYSKKEAEPKNKPLKIPTNERPHETLTKGLKELGLF